MTSGWLEKRGPLISYAWQRRWCVLIGDRLQYYADESKHELKGEIDLMSRTRMKGFKEWGAPGDAVKHSRERPHGFVVDVDPSAGKDRRLYYFDAMEAEACQSWKDILNRTCSQLQSSGKKRGPPPTNPKAFKSCIQQVLPSSVIMISGCMDKQTSSDCSNVNAFGLPADAGPGGAGGACTNSLIKAALSSGDASTWIDILLEMRSIMLQLGFEQIPQLSSSRPLNLRAPATIVHPGSEEHNGRKRALLVGINYPGTNAELRGCHNDVEKMYGRLEEFGYTDIKVLADADHPECERPDKDGIMAGLKWLAAGASLGDSLFFHYTGHGASQKDRSGDEKDGKDECLCPCDYETSGLISDDDIFLALVAPLPQGVMLTCVMDCCHSGTILDLPYSFKADEKSSAQVGNGKFTGMQPNSDFNMGSTVVLIGANAAVCGVACVAGASNLEEAVDSMGDFMWDAVPDPETAEVAEALDICDYDEFVEFEEDLEGVMCAANALHNGECEDMMMQVVQDLPEEALAAAEQSGDAFLREATGEVGGLIEGAAEELYEWNPFE